MSSDTEKNPQTPDVGHYAAPTEHDFARSRFRLLLAIICLLTLVARLAMLEEFLRKNPLAEFPISDAATYWDMAGRIAQGRLIQPTPFLSAPLYPYFLGVIRAVGGDLHAVYIIQLLAHLATGVLIADAARRRWSSATGLLAAAVFFLLNEPAVAVTRALADALQLLLTALLWRQWTKLSLSHSPRLRDDLLTAVWIGLLALSYPAALILIPIYGLWLLLWRRLSLPTIARTALAASVAALVIAPATLHNLLGHGEWISISAHGGITLLQGNNPNATGTLSAVPGISLGRAEMHEDAARLFRRDRGRDGTWREIDAHFREQAVRWWRERPRDALRLAVRKAYMFLNVRNYADIMSVAIEREAGIADRAILAPLQTPWIIGAALLGWCVALRHHLRRAPDWLLPLLPLIVVMLFFYSPRYRLPLLPVASGLAAWTVQYAFAAARARTGPMRPSRIAVPIGVLSVCLLPLPLEIYHRHMDFDSPRHIRAHFLEQLSRAQTAVAEKRTSREDLDGAAARFHSALAWWPENADACAGLATLELRAGRPADALPYLQETVRLRPDSPQDRRRLYNAYCVLQKYADAVSALRELMVYAPEDSQARLALAWLLAACPDQSIRSPDAAREQLALLQSSFPPDAPEFLDLSAAVAAAAGDFEQATALAERALERAVAQNRSRLAAALRERLDLYRRQEPPLAYPRLLRLPE